MPKNKIVYYYDHNHYYLDCCIF